VAKSKPETLAGFLAESVADFFNIGARLFRSIASLILRPGELTIAYLSDKRVRHMRPIQLYLVAAGVFFLASSLQPFITIEAAVISDYGTVIRASSAFSTVGVSNQISTDRFKSLDPSDPAILLFLEKFRTALTQSMAPFMIVSVLMFAVAVGLASPKARPLTHAVFALHWVSFFLLVMAVDRLDAFVPDLYAAGLVAVATTTHLILSLRHVYRQSWKRVIAKGLALAIAFQFILVRWIRAVQSFAFRQAGWTLPSDIL
jgi:hypothetical protein